MSTNTRVLIVALLFAHWVTADLAPAGAGPHERLPGPFDPPVNDEFFHTSGRIFPATGLLFRPLIADPTEYRSFLRFVQTTAGEDHFPVAIGFIAPIINLVLESGEALQIGLGAGVAARFDKTHNMDLKGTDWRYGFPIMWTSGDAVCRVELRHFSSHVGDEYLKRVGAARKDTLSDQVALTIAHAVRSDLRIYYSGAYGYHARPLDESFEFQAGVEYMAPGHFLSGRGPYFALDFDARQSVGFQIATCGIVGLVYPGVSGGREMHVEVVYSGGPNRMGEFLDQTEQYAGLSLGFDI